MEGITISAFFIGFSTAFFTIFAVHILAFRQNRTRFQTVLGIIMAIWAVWNLKDFVLALPGMYREGVLDWVLLVDGWSALTYTVFVFETTQPGWTSWPKLLLSFLPFAFFTVAYALWPVPQVIHAYVVFLWFYAWTVVIMAYVRMRRYLRYVRATYSNIDEIDVSWLRPVLLFAIVSQLSWLFTSVVSNVWADIFYYVSTMLLWLAVLHYTWRFHPIRVEEEEESGKKSEESGEREFPFAGRLEQVVEEQKLYLDKNLTIGDLARVLNTNRTYISNYLSQVVGLTFYDYVNRLRIEQRSIPMMQEHPEYTLEHIAAESGFSSISTFRRAFVKLTGIRPSQYERVKR